MSEKLELSELKQKHEAYLKWLASLKVGDELEVQHPWSDAEFYTGARGKGIVTKVAHGRIMFDHVRPDNNLACKGSVSDHIGGDNYIHLAPIGIEVAHNGQIGYYLTGLPPVRKPKPAPAIIHSDEAEIDLLDAIAPSFSSGNGVLVISENTPDAVILACVKNALSFGSPFKVLPDTANKPASHYSPELKGCYVAGNTAPPAKQ